MTGAPRARHADVAPGETASDLLTIVSVVFRNADYLRRNIDLTQGLNPGHAVRWIAVDNENDGAAPTFCHDSAETLAGVAPPDVGDLGSLHHALALEKGLAAVATRFVLFLDPDFFVVRRSWIANVLAHALANRLAFFGTAWHPRWYHQYRGFPAVHFLLIDLDQVPREEIDLKPAIHTDRLWHRLTRPRSRLPEALRESLKVQRCRDTGWRLHQRYRRDTSIRTEIIPPHFAPPESGRYRLERRLSGFVPERWRMFPTDGFVAESFLKTQAPDAYRAGWEEFFWRGAPFAFHLRGVGRSGSGADTADDETLLATTLENVASVELSRRA